MGTIIVRLNIFSLSISARIIIWFLSIFGRITTLFDLKTFSEVEKKNFFATSENVRDISRLGRQGNIHTTLLLTSINYEFKNNILLTRRKYARITETPKNPLYFAWIHVPATYERSKYWKIQDLYYSVRNLLIIL